MNKERILQIADDIEHGLVTIDMGSYANNRRIYTPDEADKLDLDDFYELTYEEALHTCGTTMCIAGYTVARYEPHVSVGSGRIVSRAVEILGITETHADYLFYGHSSNEQRDAPLVLRDFVATGGEVTWDNYP